MYLMFAFATDDGQNLKNDGHFGNAKYYSIYRISSEKEEFIEQRKNIKIEENEEDIHGDYNKAKAVSSVLDGINVLINKKFGPNIKRMKEKFVCVIARTESIKETINIVKTNMDKIIEEYKKGKNRKYLILAP